MNGSTATPRSGTPAQPVASEPGRSGHILLVEDDQALRTLLRTTLQHAGHTITEAANRRDALAQVQNHPDISVAIVDLGLPPMEHSTLEGLALVKTIAQQADQVKTIVLTGQDEDQSALEAIREGAFDFLSKPASAQVILNAVKRALLFHRKEKDLQDSGVARLQFNARYADGLKTVREEAEEKLIRQVLRETGFNVYQSAGKLGVKRESIYYFMKKFGITRDDH
ncbi:MAG TPA: response regulator [Pseudomonadaceae bacterium]|nr:response regulator [Pseudomonadaceae bacterium]